MTKPFRIRFFGSQSHNLKSKTCTEPFDSAQDRFRPKFPKADRKSKMNGGDFCNRLHIRDRVGLGRGAAAEESPADRVSIE